MAPRCCHDGMHVLPRATGELTRVAHHHVRSIGWMARAGFVTRALLYFIISGLAALAAFGYGGDTTDSKGALAEAYRHPFGQALLVLAAIGLFGYAAFQIHQALLDRETARQGITPRIGAAFGALVHLGLGVYAVRLVGGLTRPSSGDRETRRGTAEVLAWAPASLGSGSRRWVVTMSRIGIASRAVVGMITGAFLLIAAVTNNPQQAKGFGESLALVRQAPFGGALFAAVALGLTAYAFYQLIEARYRRVAGEAA